MQSILIFITPTSCAYDILDLPWYARKLSLSLLLSLTHVLPLALPIIRLCYFLSLSECPPPPPPTELKGHITLTAPVNSVSSSISPSAGLEVRVNVPRPMRRGSGITSPGKGHLLRVQKWFCQHIPVPREPRCIHQTLNISSADLAMQRIVVQRAFYDRRRLSLQHVGSKHKASCAGPFLEKKKVCSGPNQTRMVVWA